MNGQRAGTGNRVTKIIPVEGLVPPIRRVLGEIPHETNSIGSILNAKRVASRNGSKESAGPKPAAETSASIRSPRERI